MFQNSKTFDLNFGIFPILWRKPPCHSIRNIQFSKLDEIINNIFSKCRVTYQLPGSENYRDFMMEALTDNYCHLWLNFSV